MEWGLRDYGSETVRVWGGSAECDHEWVSEETKAESYTDKKRWQHGINREDDSENWTRDVQKYAWCQKCGAWQGSLGLEPHPPLYVDHLIEVFREVKRVLKKTGSFYLNLGDTYYASGGKGGQYEKFSTEKGAPTDYKQNSKMRSNWLQPKQLLLIPSRTAIALQEDGWLLRNDIVWSKPNAMPSSVKDRLSNHWEHLFHFVKSQKYYYDLDAIREQHKESTIRRTRERTYKSNPEIHYPNVPPNLAQGRMRFRGKNTIERVMNPLGKNPGDVYQGKFDGFGSDSEKYGSPRARTQRNKQSYQDNNPHTMRLDPEAHIALNEERPSDLSYPQGKNPGDIFRPESPPQGNKNKHKGIWQFDSFQRRKIEQTAEFFIEKGSGGNLNLPQPEHPLGKNPGDVFLKQDNVPSRNAGMYKGFNKRWKEKSLMDREGHSGYFTKEGVPLVDFEKGKNPSDYWEINTQPFKGAHFAVFPEQLCVRPILSSCLPDGVILDPFCGSGTALIVAKKLGRAYIGIDCVQAYCIMSEKRLAEIPIKLDQVGGNQT